MTTSVWLLAASSSWGSGSRFGFLPNCTRVQYPSPGNGMECRLQTLARPTSERPNSGANFRRGKVHTFSYRSARHQTHSTAFRDDRPDGAQMVAALPAAWTIRPAPPFSRSASSSTENSSHHRSATGGVAQNAADLRLTPSDPRIRSADRPTHLPSRTVFIDADRYLKESTG